MEVKVRILLPKVFGVSDDTYVLDVGEDMTIADLIKLLGIKLKSEALLRSSIDGRGLLVLINDEEVTNLSKPINKIRGCKGSLELLIAPVLDGG